MNDIVERLRAGEPCREGCGAPCGVMDAKSGCTCAMAADEIDRLRAALVLLRGSVSTAEEGRDLALKEGRAEIDRLRAALRDVLSYVPHGDMPVTIYDNARAALDEKA